MAANICITLKSFEKISFPRKSSVGLPTKRILYTVIRSPHIDKKSREQFEMKIRKRLIHIRTDNSKLHEIISYCKLHDLRGVQMKATFSYQTRFNLRKTLIINESPNI